MLFFEVSAKNNTNINEAFESLVEEIINSGIDEGIKKKEKTIHLSSQKNGCC